MFNYKAPQYTLDPSGRILNYSLLGGGVLSFLGAIFQSINFLQGGSEYFVAPAFLLASLISLYLLRWSTHPVEFKAKAFALTFAGVALGIIPAAAEAFFIAMMFLTYVSVTWLFVKPSRTIPVFWLVVSACALILHTLFSPEQLYIGKTLIALFISVSLVLVVYLYSASLTYEKELLAHTLSTTQQGVVLRVNEGVHLVHLDPLAQQLLDVPQAQMSFMDLVASFPDQADQDFLLVHCAGINPDLNGEWERKFKYRDERYIRIRRFPRGDSCVWLLTDETQSENARIAKEQEEKRREIVSQAANIAFFEYAYSTDQLSGNPVLLQRYGLPIETESLCFSDMADRYSSDDLSIISKEISVGAGQSIGWQREFIHGQQVNDSQHTFKVVGQNVVKNGRKVFLGASIDITDQVRAMEVEQQSNKALIEQRERQAQMYAVLGHELRTPTAALKMLLDDADSEEARVDTDLFKGTVDQLLGVIETLRTVAQPERMLETVTEPVILADLIQSQAGILKPLAKSHQVNIQLDVDQLSNEVVALPAQLLRQLLSNLIKNAIIHSGCAQLKVGANSQIRATNKAVTVWIDDDGKGIEAEKREVLFDAFERGDSEAEGTGLGLFICREIARSMGGELSLVPSELGGARFEFSFKAALGSEITTQELGGEKALEGLRVLLAEDNATIQLLTRRLLEKRGAMVEVANNGREALIAYELGEYDLVLSDIFMPEMNGYALVSELRARGCELPIIGLTAATIGHETEAMSLAGADIVMSKPVDIRELEKFVFERSSQMV